MTNDTNTVLPNLQKILQSKPPLLLNPKSGKQPSDLTFYPPLGVGLIYPWQHTPFNAVNMMTHAPIHEQTGGVVYFGARISKEDFETLARLVLRPDFSNMPTKHFIAYTEEAINHKEQWYLRQMRVISDTGLAGLYGAAEWEVLKDRPEQSMTDVEALWTFIQDERDYWYNPENPNFTGWFGGDGNFESEMLSFGLIVENSYYGIYRIWSRCWLITK